MVRTLVIEPAGNKWGSERALLDLLDCLPDAGVDVAVCLPPQRPLAPELARRRIRMFASYVYALHEKTKFHRAWAAINVFIACLRFRPDVIYLNQSGAYKIALVAAFILRIPMVAHIRIFEDVGYIARQKPNPKILRAIVAISSAIKDEIRGFRALECITSHTIIDAYALHTKRLVSPVSPSRIAGRVACVGRIAPVKGQDVLIAALPHLATTGPIECLMAGNDEGVFADRLKEAVRRGTGLTTVRWLGIIDDSVGLLRTSIAMVAPSHSEALGRVIFEAWEAGAVPIVYADSGGAAEIVAASNGGVLYETQSGESLAAAVKMVLETDPANRVKLVSNGRAWMSRNCDPRAYAQTMAAIFYRAASGQPVA